MNHSTTSSWKPLNISQGIYYFNGVNNNEHHYHKVDLFERNFKLSDNNIVVNTNNNKSLVYYTSSHSSFTSSTLSNLYFNDCSSFINDVQDRSAYIDKEFVEFTSISESIDGNSISQIHTQFPLCYDYIKIPTKVATTVKRHTPRKLLYAIHADLDVAVEMCLLFVSQLTCTYFSVKDGSNPDGWKPLKSKYLRELITVSSTAYKKTRLALEYPLSNGPIIECDHTSCKGEKSYNHRLGASYIGNGIVSYQLKTDEAKTALNSHYNKCLNRWAKNPIVDNLMKIYPKTTLPTDNEIIEEANRLVGEGYRTRNQKKLKFLNKKAKSYYHNPGQYCFVEDATEIYGYLKGSYGRILNNGTPESGGRIVDMFTLMPSWIRKMVKIDGELCTECDYSALHPNIASCLYGGSTDYITHDQLATTLGVDVSLVKTEHLSFFNKKVRDMKKSPLFQYYNTTEPKMLQDIITEKQTSKYKHKITSRRMFEKEVQIMKDVIGRLNSEGIYVLYVYDALLCKPKYAERVIEVMNSTILEHSVKTKAKCTPPPLSLQNQ